MGHDKLRKFAENETFACLLQPDAAELLSDGYFALKDHPVKGHWGERFANPSAPIVLELGCGKGEYTIDLAQRRPSANYIGVDIKGARLWKGAKYATAHALGNVGFLRTRIEFISAFFAPGEVSEIWLTFSDPQVRSENSRLTSPVFLERYARFLAPGGLIHLKTDSQFLYQYTLAVCRANSLEIVAATEDLYAEAERFDSCLTQVQTFYEGMFREQGYPIRYLCFRLGAKGNASEAGAPDGTAVHLQSPSDFDADYWRSIEGNRTLFGRDTAETRRQKLRSGPEK